MGVGNWYFSPARQAEAVNLEWECKKVAERSDLHSLARLNDGESS